MSQQAEYLHTLSDLGHPMQLHVGHPSCQPPATMRLRPKFPAASAARKPAHNWTVWRLEQVPVPSEMVQGRADRAPACSFHGIGLRAPANACCSTYSVIFGPSPPAVEGLPDTSTVMLAKKSVKCTYGLSDGRVSSYPGCPFRRFTWLDVHVGRERSDEPISTWS